MNFNETLNENEPQYFGGQLDSDDEGSSICLNCSVAPDVSMKRILTSPVDTVEIEDQNTSDWIPKLSYLNATISNQNATSNLNGTISNINATTSYSNESTTYWNASMPYWNASTTYWNASPTYWNATPTDQNITTPILDSGAATTINYDADIHSEFEPEDLKDKSVPPLGKPTQFKIP
uniref:Uncharacterized protein n=2 Tax=Lygus hesperus TaxID=30085 RepID=A0A0K8SXD2_LYGHE